MKTTINSTTYEYTETVFGNKILAYSNLGGGLMVCNEEFVCDERIESLEQLNHTCKEIEQRYE